MYLAGVSVRRVAAMLKAIHASEDVVAAPEKAIRVVEKLHGFRLTKAAELAEAGSRETLTYYTFPESTGGASAPTIRSSAFCARSGDVRLWSEHSPTANRP
jgi:hypothetical protein